MEYKKKKGIKYTIVSIKIPMGVINEERQTIQQHKRQKTKRLLKTTQKTKDYQ